MHQITLPECPYIRAHTVRFEISPHKLVPDPQLDSPSSGIDVGAPRRIGTAAGLTSSTPQRSTRYPMDVRVSVVDPPATRERGGTEVGRHWRLLKMTSWPSHLKSFEAMYPAEANDDPCWNQHRTASLPLPSFSPRTRTERSDVNYGRNQNWHLRARSCARVHCRERC